MNGFVALAPPIMPGIRNGLLLLLLPPAPAPQGLLLLGIAGKADAKAFAEGGGLFVVVVVDGVDVLPVAAGAAVVVVVVAAGVVVDDDGVVVAAGVADPLTRNKVDLGTMP